MVKIFAATVSAAAYLYLQVLPCAAVFPHGILVQMTTILQVRVHEHVLGNTCASALAKYSCYNAESQRAVRELRRPGGAKPHGEVRSMTIPAGGQVSKLQNLYPLQLTNLLLHSVTAPSRRCCLSLNFPAAQSLKPQHFATHSMS